MTLKLKILVVALMSLFYASQTSLAAELIVGSASTYGTGTVTLPLSVVGNTDKLGSVTVALIYDGGKVSLSSKDISLAADTSAASWKLHASSMPPLRSGMKGVLLNIYQADGAPVIASASISLVDIQLNILKAISNAPLKVSSLTVRDGARAEITGYIAKP